MIKTKILAACILCLTVNYVIGQDEIKIKFGDVSAGDLAVKSYPIDPASDAVILYDKGTIDFVGNNNGGLEFEYVVHRRIHILTNKKYDLATHQVECFTPNVFDEEKLSSIEAVTYNLVDGKVEKSKMKDEGIFKTKNSRKWTLYKFTLPNVKEGSIIEYKYKLKSQYYYNLKDWKFQSDVPTLWSEFIATIPNFYKYLVASQGFNEFHVQKQNIVNVNYRINFAASRTEANDWQNVSTTATQYRWVNKNLKAITEEPILTSVNNYISKVYFQLSAITAPLTPRLINNNWEKLNEEFLKDDDFNTVYDKDQKEVKQLVKEVFGLKTLTDDEKSRLLYAYIRDQFTCEDETRGLYLTKKIKQIIETKRGTASDLNLLLVACYNNAGFDAVPVILSLRNRGYINPYYPLTEKFNYVIAKVIVGGKNVLLDPATKKLGYGKLTSQCRNGYGRAIEKFGTEVVISPDSLKEKTTTFIKMEVQDNMLKINYQIKENSHNSLELRSQADKFKIIESYKKNISATAIVSNEKVDNFDNADEVIMISMDINQPIENDSLLYISLASLPSNIQNPFTNKERTLPIEYPFLAEDSYNVVFKIPDGYAVEEMPKSEAFTSDDQGSFQFEYRCSTINGAINIRSKMKLNKTLFLKEEYISLKECYNLIVKKQSEQIVLKKI